MSDVSREVSPEEIVQELFCRVRKPLKLGMREYLSALEAVEDEWGASRDATKQMLLLLWCSSLAERDELQTAWEAAMAALVPTTAPDRGDPPESEFDPALQPKRTAQTQSTPSPKSIQPETKTSLKAEPAPLPVKAPVSRSEMEEDSDWQTYGPLSRRSMAYAWRNLRRSQANGVQDVLDVRATVDRAARQGFFLAPVYRRREINRARLLLLVDRDGSMMPMHRITDDLVNTARHDDSDNGLAWFEAYYFHNIPGEYIFQDAHLTSPVQLEQALAGCDSDTSVMVVSDAGAARGHWRMERIRGTTQFLVRLKWRTRLVGWLNPMPRDRWQNTSAEAISYLVPMQPMDKDGFDNLIDIVRGQVGVGMSGGGL